MSLARAAGKRESTTPAAPRRGASGDVRVVDALIATVIASGAWYRGLFAPGRARRGRRMWTPQHRPCRAAQRASGSVDVLTVLINVCSLPSQGPRGKGGAKRSGAKPAATVNVAAGGTRATPGVVRMQARVYPSRMFTCLT